MLPSIASRRVMLLSQSSFKGMRTFATATKTYVVKANVVKSASAYKPTTSRYTSAKTATTATTSTAKTDNPAEDPLDSPPREFSSYPDHDELSSSSITPAIINAEANQDLTTVFSSGGSALKDSAIGVVQGADDVQDWTRSFSGMATEPFEKHVAELLMKPLDADDIEIKPDGLLYLPEIKYRRILNKAFGPGGWGLAPRSEHSVSPKTISREYALICNGRFVSTARGEQDYFDPNGLPTASEGCKSNALMRCCKDLGIASELWDPSFIRKFKKQYCEEMFVEHAVTKKKKKLWKRKDQPDFDYPYSKSK
ncbi:hypothetical protein BGZ76_010452 [Entomortierella beljakovae]|nr:hypothetical protein BGZ76_010452 [Entomortierella beljakovae]